MNAMALAAIAKDVPVTVPQVRLLATAAVRAMPEPAEPQPIRTIFVPQLTGREYQLLHGMANGLTNDQIANSLGLSVETVKTTAKRLFRRLRAVDRAHAVALGFRCGLLRPEHVKPKAVAS